MITIKTKEQIEQMRKAGEILAACHRNRKTDPSGDHNTGNRPVCRGLYEEKWRYTGTEGLQWYPYATCASVNDVICHGFPGKYVLKDGDIVTIDMVVNLDGWLADSAWSYAVGNVSPEAQHLLDVTKNLYTKALSSPLSVTGSETSRMPFKRMLRGRSVRGS